MSPPAYHIATGTLLLFSCLALATAALSGAASRGLPLSPEGLGKAHYFATEPDGQNKTAPVWPFQWNATQAKINPFNSHIWWAKFYYDWPHGWTRTDFMNGYYSTEDKWSLNCSVVFANNQVWFTFPEEQGCYLDHDGLGTISPWWLQTGVYKGSDNFRGLYADRWTLPELGIDYFARSDSIHTPLRSTNQAEDPGATDYLDVVLGPQDPALFKLPTYCKNIINKGCPPDWP
ncbi:uncharacterized protein ACA1_282980 [Acanthamoeba castellanii str. Neff]|uniref:Uncharacterized protein n=1 Tax=Acanthamoeba castellanii (strain ATCC 30010 / Neff) TaxID=1257118 RepID=L8H7B8_ACACF|nr:uncharacterized protein ACA1_282980 [Acanthamoeba castellanii str. Neff]ELR21112.1 hypothetical protein ACA1_282980 [Acanthamoeba castellanii str. Neff]